jgi:protein-L-isoaspartate(D-aspartate) O-methyltransferase
MSQPGERLARRLRRYVSDERVLDAIARVPRDAFVPGPWRWAAWRNRALPIACGQTISQPLVVARMSELLDLRPTDRVLDVGTGSGYHAAILAQLAQHVWSVEIHAELAHEAGRRLEAAGIDNVTVLVGDGREGHRDAAPYDAINVAAAAGPEVPPALEQQLAPDGRLVLPLGERVQMLTLLRRTEDGMQRQAREPVRFVPLV